VVEVFVPVVLLWVFAALRTLKLLLNYKTKYDCGPVAYGSVTVSVQYFWLITVFMTVIVMVGVV